MASKIGLAGGIPERKVRPIWDAVDSRQFKSALKLSTALLSKYPNSPYVMALKALVLERMGKPDEALTISIIAKEQLCSNNVVHVDELTLSTLQIVFQRLDHLELATSCYEHACQKYSNNLELMMGLFNCYIREYSFVKQQQTAMKMYKIVGEERFLLWAVCSIQLQVLCSNAGDKLLHLAEVLIKKHMNSHGLHEHEALLVYISLLEQQGKYSYALEIISGNLGSLIAMEVDKLRLQGRLLCRAGDYAAAADIYQKVLESCPDDWDSFIHYLDCLLEVDIYWPGCPRSLQIPSSEDLKTFRWPHCSVEMFASRMSRASAFVKDLQSKVEGDVVRCPYLADVEIVKRCRIKGEAGGDELVEILFKYFCRFSHMSSFASDVEDFLCILDQHEKMELLERCEKLPVSCFNTPTKNVGHAITVFKLQDMLGALSRLPTAELRKTAVKMLELYVKNLALSKDLDPQENIQGEELLSMTCNVLVQLFWRTNCFGYLLEAILILEFGLKIRRFTWQYKILLVHLYSHLGAISLALQWYKTMDIKNILLETVSHHVMPQMLRSPFLSDLSDILQEYLKFMGEYTREAADHTFLACRHRNYTKIIEFVQFKERLQHSHQYLNAKLEASILQLKNKENNLEQVENILQTPEMGKHEVTLSNINHESLTFNHDLRSRPWWSPTTDINHLRGPFNVDIASSCKLSSKQDFEREKQHVVKSIGKRSLLSRIVYLSVQAATSCLTETPDINGSDSPSDPEITSELRFLLEKYSANLGHPFDDAVELILDISEGRRSPKDFGSDMVYWMNFAIFYNSWNLCSNHLKQAKGVESSSWNVVDQLVKKCIGEQLSSAEPILACPGSGSNTSLLVQLISESCAWHILVIQSCVRSMLPPQKRKKKGNSTSQCNHLLTEALQKSDNSMHSAISKVIRWLDDQLNRPVDETLDLLFTQVRSDQEDGNGKVLQILEEVSSANNHDLGDGILQAVQSWNSIDVIRKVINGQRTTLSEFREICDSKLKILKSMKL